MKLLCKHHSLASPSLPRLPVCKQATSKAKLNFAWHLLHTTCTINVFSTYEADHKFTNFTGVGWSPGKKLTEELCPPDLPPTIDPDTFSAILLHI